MLSEIISWYNQKNKKMILFKVDFEKAYDSVNWDYLLFMLLSLGFSQKWCSWIKGFLFSARSSVLVNGSPTREFLIKRSLRQGDPLNPFLFITIMEGLHLAFHRAMEISFIRGIKVGSNSIHLSHFIYADDVIIFLGMERYRIETYSSYFGDFLSSLSFNSEVQELRLTDSNSDVNFENAQVLEFPIGSRYMTSLFLNFPHGRRVSYLQEARFFFLRGSNTSKNMWIKGDKVLASFERGGLNVGSLKAFNILANIVLTCNKIISTNLLPPDTFNLVVGNGHSIRFCHDTWCGNSNLSSRFNRLFHLDTNLDGFIVDKIVNGNWSFPWVRGVTQGRNKQALSSMLTDIGLPQLTNQTYCWMCTLTSDNMFTVRAARFRIDCNILPTLHLKTLWYDFVPRKVNVFLWSFRLDSFPIR
ncbi:uncharacterized protein [Rutidosis leptorrhynchoides]|uniref:uncharacterized protein n=1 Tax=Rutidosis leptorrhynchoides TaxID=125765 RepID=UPI003A999109